MEVLAFGRSLLVLAAILCGGIALLSLLGLLLRDRRLVASARTGFYALLVLIAGSSACLVYGFVAGAYNNEYIFNYSEREIPTGFKVAGLWAGLQGSLLFWTLVLAAVSAAVAFQHRFSSRHPTGRRLEPYIYLVLTAVLGFFVAVCFYENPFEEMDLEKRLGVASHFRIPMDSEGNLLDGKGLNPQLMNYWFVIHPPCLYLGLVLFTVPFAFALAALLAGELGDYWIRVTRRWTMVAWMFLTCGIILGGLWAYRQLGWGGYWAWDPVENASILPWCTATAFLHSVMVQERRDMLRWWNAFLIVLTFFLTIEATYMTRSGEVASVHAFAGGSEIGAWFRAFKFVLAGTGLFLLFFRFRELRGTHRLESLFSREAAFFFNNLVLLAIGLTIWFLSWLPNHTHAYLGSKQTVEGSFFNGVMTPLFVLLLFLTAVGPGLGWVKSTPASLRRNFRGPFIASFLALCGVYLFWYLSGKIGSATEVFYPKILGKVVLALAERSAFIDGLLPLGLQDWMRDEDSPGLYHAVGLYPTGLLLFIVALIISTVGAEFLRGIRSRMRARGEDPLSAFFGLVSRDNRRYGGYTVHIGIAVLALGIVINSMFKTEVKLHLHIGESAQVGDYVITPLRSNRTAAELHAAVAALKSGSRTLAELEPGFAYLRDEVVFRVTRAEGPVAGTPFGLKDAHGQAREATTAVSARAESAPSAAIGGELVCELVPENRYYPKQEQWISEVSIHRMLLRDIYIHYQSVRDEQGRLMLEVFLNPFMMLIYAGWFIMVFGGLFVLLPLSPNRVGLAE
jgi:cytochrome c-type biogenesis protein CcmF